MEIGFQPGLDPSKVGREHSWLKYGVGLRIVTFILVIGFAEISLSKTFNLQIGISIQIVSASQAGDIQFVDIRSHRDTYLTIEAHRGSLTALAIHRHAPIVASGSAKQLIKVFSLEGEQLNTIRYYPTIMAQKIGSVGCLAFHPYEALLAAGAVDALVSIHAD